MNILLRHMLPLSGVKLRVSWGDGTHSDPKNGVERGHRIEPTIKPGHVFIEVGLQMFWLDTAMMRALDPSLHIAEDEMDHGKVLSSIQELYSKNRVVLQRIVHIRRNLGRY